MLDNALWNDMVFVCIRELTEPERARVKEITTEVLNMLADETVRVAVVVIDFMRDIIMEDFRRWREENEKVDA